MLTTTTHMLRKAQEGRYAVGHFNASNLETAQAIIAAATELSAPVIVATSVKAIEFAGINNIAMIIRRLADEAPVPVALHLDHGPSREWAQTCLVHGYTSIMIDSSHEPFGENLRITKDVVNLCKPAGIAVEAEIGVLKGVEDDVSAKEHIYTSPDEAARFAEETGCSSLAIAIGTSHGAYKHTGTVHLDLDRLSQIRERVSIPLVLHGASGVPKELIEKAIRYGARIDDASGIPDEDIREAIRRGICKVNTDTDLRLAFTAAGRAFYAEKPSDFDPRSFLAVTRDALKAIVKSRIELFGSAGKA